MIRGELQAKGQAQVPRDVSLPAVCCSIGQRVDTKQCVFWEDFGSYSEQNGDTTDMFWICSAMMYNYPKIAISIGKTLRNHWIFGYPVVGHTYMN